MRELPECLAELEPRQIRPFLQGLERNVAGEPVGHDDVDLLYAQQVTALDAAWT